MVNPAELAITKQELQRLINELMDDKCSLFWRYRDDFIFLIIDSDYIDELAFTKTQNTLFLNIQSLKQLKNKKVKNKIIKSLRLDIFTEEIEKVDKVTKSKKHLQLEIDYHLMELHDYIQQDKQEMIEAVKNILISLTNQLKYYER